VTDPPDPLFTKVAQALAAEYELLRPLGRGGMAVVFLARERSLKRLVAIKVLDPELGASPLFRTRFEREAETAAQLQHPHIVPIFRVGESDGIAYYAMAYVEGESLAERMQREGPLPLTEALRLAREVTGALAAAHRRGIVHRDVKPQNILLEKETGRALVTDFGIARIAQPSGGDGDRLTGLGLVMGTPRYMSPEQAAGDRDVTAAADLYALGVVCYEMLTGAYPYKMPGGGGPLAIPYSHPLVPVRERAAHVPADVAQTVERLMALEPSGRPASAETVLQVLDGSATLPPRPAVRGPLSRRLRWLGMTAGVFAVGLPLFLFLVRPGGPRMGVDPRKSILIGFFENTTRDPAVEWLRLGGVELLSQSLKRWQDLQVVDVERLLDLARRAGVASDAALSRDDAVRLARAAGVWTTTVGSILRLGDRVRITVRVYDVTTRRQLTSAAVEARPDSTLPLAFASLADQILDVAGAARAALRAVEPPTRSLAAYEAYIEGVAARSRWDIPRAIAAFRRAVTADSSFALAYYEWSIATIGSEFLAQETRFVDLADSAFRYAADRPPRERLLIQAYHAYVHADFGRARALAGELLALDSTVTDAWVVDGDASWIDLSLVKNARGGDSVRANFTRALRSYERALALDESDHRLFTNIALILSPAALGGERSIMPAFRDSAGGPVNRFLFRVPSRIYTPIYQGDTIALVPAESVARRYPGPVLDSLRGLARRRMAGIMDRWLAVAPDEGQAHLLQSMLLQAEKDYDGAERSLGTAMRIGATSSIPLEFMKLSWRLEARRLPAAVSYVDTLARTGRLDTLVQTAPIAAGVFVNAGYAGGRLAEAGRYTDRVLSASARIRVGGGQDQVREINTMLFPLIVAANTDRLTAAQLARATADLERRVAAMPDTLRPRVRAGLGRIVTFLAATLGDTAAVRRWTPTSGTPWHGAAAWAAAAAGDTAAAARGLAAGDTVRAPPNEFALARAAELLGRPREALRHYERLDSLSYAALGAPDPDWLLLVRSYPGRAAQYQALGDTARAREYYRRFVELWRDADDELRPEVERAERVLGLPPRRDTN
jgi:serine/threonine-protein kinase